MITPPRSHTRIIAFFERLPAAASILIAILAAVIVINWQATLIPLHNLEEDGAILTWSTVISVLSVASLILLGSLLVVVRRTSRMIVKSNIDREQLLAQTETAREAAEAASTAKSNFLTVMSHELRTPLSAIIGYEEILADEITGPLNHHQHHQLVRIKASANNLLKLIDQILDFSRVDARREAVWNDAVSANALADEAASLVDPYVREHGLHFVVHHIEPDITLRIDTGKVRQILVNLLSNAVKFTPSGMIEMRVEANGGSSVKYRVRDTGIGIPQEHLDNIFDAFWQVERPNIRRIGGAGLGLSVTRQLARLIGGAVSVESRLGEGSTFTVTLPIRRAN